MIISNIFRNRIHFVLAIWLLLFNGYAYSNQEILTSDERAWLNAHPEISLIMWDDYPPVSYADKNSKLKGYIPDYIALLESKLNYKFKQFVPSDEEDVNKGPQVSHSDIVSLLADTPERRVHWNFSPTLLSFPLHLITRNDQEKNITLQSLNGKKLSIVSGYATQEFVEQHYPHVKIDLVDDTCQGLQHVEFKESVAMLTDLPVASWCLKTQGLINLKVAGQTEFNYEMSLAIRNDWPILFSIIKKGMAAISPAELQDLQNHWLNQDAFEKNWLHSNRVWIIALILFMLAGALIRVYAWDSNLQSNILNRIANFDEDDNAAPEADKTRNDVIPGILVILLVLLALLGALVSNEFWVSSEDRMLLGILVTSLMLLTLFGGYKLGSLKRNEEKRSLFERLAEQIRTRKTAEQQAIEQALRLKKQQTAIQTLTEKQRQVNESIEAAFRDITQIAAETLNVERASIWLLSPDRQELECKDTYLKSSRLHTIGNPLLASELPEYFKFISQQRVLAANDVMLHPATVEFRDGYVQENNIGAMLDGSIWLNGQMVGTVCLEHVGVARQWTLDEQSFVGTISDLVRLCIETDGRHKAEEALFKYSEKLEDVVKARTQSLLDSQQQLASVIKYVPIPILTIKLDGEIVGFNPEAESVTGINKDEAIGKNFMEFFVAKDSFKKALIVGAGAKKGRDFRNIELTFKCADGKEIEFECSIVRAGQSVSGGGQMIAIGQDITQKKALQETLIRAREAAESADLIKSMFVASMSHELRTPLNSIIGFLGVVLQGMSGELQPKQKDQLGRAYHSAKHLLSLITDVIDISKIEAGFLQIEVETFSLKPMLNEVEQVVAHIAEGKHLLLSIECDESITITSDRKRLYQAILNVVSNALKYTEVGSVHVNAQIVNDQLIVTTQDTGIGISESALEKLFQPFERAESHLKIKTLGTGLGLYLTRKILSQLLGGSIEVESKLNKGSTFTIKVPIKISEQALINNQSILEDHNL